MNNDILSNTINDNSNNIIFETETETMTTASYYDYYEVVTRQDTIINKIDEQTKMINTSFCFISFLITIYLLYFLVRNMLGRR